MNKKWLVLFYFVFIFKANRTILFKIFYNFVKDQCYIGCFLDQETRDFPHLEFDVYGSLTIGYCINTCHSKGYLYAGLQNRFENH